MNIKALSKELDELLKAILKACKGGLDNDWYQLDIDYMPHKAGVFRMLWAKGEGDQIEAEHTSLYRALLALHGQALGSSWASHGLGIYKFIDDAYVQAWSAAQTEELKGDKASDRRLIFQHNARQGFRLTSLSTGVSVLHHSLLPAMLALPKAIQDHQAK